MATPTSPITPAADPEAFKAEWRQWHTERVRRLADPHGFLAATALHWLDGEPRAVAGIPGRWWTERDIVAVKLEDGETLSQPTSQGNRTITGVHEFGPLPERGDVQVELGDTRIEIAKRGGRYIVRPRSPWNPLLRGFRGVPAYAPDPRWAVPGVFRRFDEPKPTSVGSVADGIRHVYDAPGTVEFELDGAVHSLTAFNGHRPGTLTVLFTDATSGHSTYAANRSLELAPAPDGTVVVDFNRAVNLPCAFTDLATCPLPPAGNRLPVAVEAGETIPYERGA